MSTLLQSPPLPTDPATVPAGRRALDAVARYLWTGDPGACEAHWGALTLGLTAALSALVAFLAGVATPERSVLDIVFPTLLVALLLDLVTRFGPTRPWVERAGLRRLLGPVVLVAAVLATGLPDIVTMMPTPTAPLIIAALVYGAMSRGFVPAMILAAGITITLPLLHATTSGGTIDPAGMQVVLRGLAAVGGATGVGLAWRHLHRGQERVQRRVAELERITGIVRRFDGSSPTHEVLEDVARDLVAATQAGAVVIHGVDGTDLAPVAMAGDAVAPRPSGSATGVAPRVRGGGARVGLIAVPVVHEDAQLAVIELRGLPSANAADARALTELVASAIAGALRAAQLDAQRCVRLATVERLVRSGRTLSANLDRSRVVAEACALATDLLDADMAAFIRRTDDGTWAVEHGVGFDAGAITAAGTPGERDVHPSPTGAPGLDAGPNSVWSGVLGAIPEAGDLPYGLARELLMEGEVVGVLGVARRRPGRAFGEPDMAAADLLAIQVETALRNAVQHGHAVELAMRDGLTGLMNRRYFDEALRRAAAAAGRSEAPLSLLVMDLDRFSLVNNEHGHAMGDEVLRRVASVLRRQSRDADVVARYGGEEFVLIAPGAGAEAAQLIAERVRIAVSDLSREPIDGRWLRMSVSIGVATLGDDEVVDATDLFRRADDRLRAAKLAGRNRVIGA